MRKFDRTDSKNGKGKRRLPMRQRSFVKFQLPKDAVIDYKNISLLQKYLTDRGKIFSRRVSEVTAREQRQLVSAIKRARFLALLPTGGVRK